MLKDWYDSVRDQACQLLEFILTNLLRHSPIQSGTQRDLLQMLRASMSIGQDERMWAPTREAAESESEFINYMFKDTQEFLKLLITAMMDEPSTRESCTRSILKLNEQLPFLLLNDYRISCANNSLQRKEVVKQLLDRAAGQ